MRSLKQLVVALCVVVTLGAVGLSVSQGQDEKPKPQTTMPTADWHKDTLCRMIFFTVLEGLYTDGVSNEVVDLVLGARSKNADKIKHNFVFRCDLCHAVYEAFRTYRSRPATFLGSEASTFGSKAIDPKLLERLKSDQPRTRVLAMGTLVQPWIKTKLLSMSLEEKDTKRILQGLVELAKEGAAKTQELRQTDPAYGNWDFYGSCQACQAIEDVSRMGLQGKKK